MIYKYLNPNLIAVLSESVDKSVDRSSLLLQVIDAVTGEVKNMLFLIDSVLSDFKYYQALQS